jgi:hypothetical protein
MLRGLKRIGEQYGRAESGGAPSSTGSEQKRPLPSRAILRLVAQGKSVRDIATLFPEFSADEIQMALLRVADLAQDEGASLPAEDAIAELIQSAQSRAALSEEEAMAIALEMTNEVRKQAGSKR